MLGRGVSQLLPQACPWRVTLQHPHPQGWGLHRSQRGPGGSHSHLASDTQWLGDQTSIPFNSLLL